MSKARDVACFYLRNTRGGLFVEIELRFPLAGAMHVLKCPVEYTLGLSPDLEVQQIIVSTNRRDNKH